MKNLSIFSKLFISGVALTGAGAMGTFGILSLLSDVVVDNGTFTAAPNVISLDTLDISGSYRVYLNGSSTPEATNTVTLDAGDLAVVKATITNSGNASAWIRDNITFTYATPFATIASGVRTVSDFENSTVNPNTVENGGKYEFAGASMEGQAFGTTTRVLNGTGTGAQIETVDNAPAALKLDLDATYPWRKYNAAMFIASNTYEVAYSIYFDPDNATAGGETLTFAAKTQAMQYRTNNEAFPSTTCDTEEPPTCTSTWDVVVSSPAGL